MTDPNMTRPRRRRAALIVALVVAVAAPLAYGGWMAVRISSTGGSSDTDDFAETAEVEDAAPTTVLLNAATFIGTWKKSADQQSAQQVGDVLAVAGGVGPLIARYEHQTDPAQTAVVWAGTSRTFQVMDAPSKFDTYFTGLYKRLNTSRPMAPLTVHPGIVGGKAVCAETDSAGVAYIACAWIGPGVMITALFHGVGFEDAGNLVGALAQSMVTTS